jgi:hypothetical protein
MAGVLGKYDTPQPVARKRFVRLIGSSINLREVPSDTKWTGRLSPVPLRMQPLGGPQMWASDSMIPASLIEFKQNDAGVSLLNAQSAT